MSARSRVIPRTFSIVLAACLWAASGAAQARAIAPLPPSEYGVRQLCGGPAPGRAACLALRLVPETPTAQARTQPLGAAAPAAGPLPAGASSGAFGLRPQDLHNAYSLPTTAVGEQTIAIVDAYNDPRAEADLKGYDEEFALPECTKANGCLQQLNEHGESTNLPFPKTVSELESRRSKAPKEAKEAEGWSVEISLDIQTAHAICQSCRLLLVEASSPSYEDLFAAEDTAVAKGATVISNSWGGEVPSTGDDPAFNHPGVVITASAGDDGYLNWLSPEPGFAEYPASSTHVVAVGGTRLRLNGARTAWEGESVWNDGSSTGKSHGAGGGGCEERFAAPSWQQATADWAQVGCANARSVGDVAADADPYSGVAVHDSLGEECTGEGGWCTIGGTSLASPIIAGVFALAGGANGVPYPARTLYESAASRPASLHDVTSGSNGACGKPVNKETGEASCTSAEEAQASCQGALSCLAAPGYDGPTGVGTPNGTAAFRPGSGSSEALQSPAQAPSSPPAPAGQSPQAAPPTSLALAQTAASTPPAPSAPARLLSLALTRRALAALHRAWPRVSVVRFAFTLTAPSDVTVTLAKRVRGPHARWVVVSGLRALAALAGRDRAQLRGHRALSSGRYKLTLTLPGGRAASLTFLIA